MHPTLPLVLAAAALPALAQPIQSPEVHSDNSVTFRFKALHAQQVFLALEGATHVAMQRDDGGVWSLTKDQQSGFITHSVLVSRVNTQ
ncbi:MAG: hypothetical protein ACLQGV_11005 [Bryobacteraceae bacterium]